MWAGVLDAICSVVTLVFTLGQLTKTSDCLSLAAANLEPWVLFYQCVRLCGERPARKWHGVLERWLGHELNNARRQSGSGSKPAAGSWEGRPLEPTLVVH